MDTVIVSNGQFYSHYPKNIAKGTVDAEAVLVRLDPEWDNLTVRIHWLNVASGVEKVVLLERDNPNTIPWEVLTDLGELRMGLVGMDGDTTVKPTIWLTYGYVVDGVDPGGGDDPQEPTKNYLAQMVEQATQANQAAQDAKDAAKDAAESLASAGPYAEEAKQAAEAAKASQDAATSARQANEAAQTAQEAVASIGDAVQQAQQAATDAGAAKSAAETAQAAAAQSAGTAQTAATTASKVAQTAQSAATQAGEYLASVEADAQAAANAATAAGKSQEDAQTAAQDARNARDQANTAATTAQGHASAATTAKDAAEQAATNAGNAQAGADQSAQAAASSASAAQEAQKAAEAAAALLPTPTPEDAGKVPMVNPEGDGFIFSALSAGGAGEWELVADVTIEEEITKLQIDKNQDGIPFRYTEMYFLCTLITNDSPGEFWVNNSNMMITPTKNISNNLYGFLKVYNDKTLISTRGTNASLSNRYGAYMYYALRDESEITQFLLTNIRAQAGSTLQVYGR